MRVALLALLLLLTLPSAAQAPDYQRLLSLREVDWRMDGSNVVVTGVVVNEASRAFRDVKVDFNGFDAQGYPVVVGAGVTIGFVAPGAEARFEILAGAITRVARGEADIVGGRLDPAR